MHWPLGIAIDGNNIMYACNDYFVSMFDTNRKFLGKFGWSGCPFGVIVVEW